MNYDVIVVGGSFAGLSAALQVARAKRRVLVIDAGEPRNRFSRAVHGLFGHDGSEPAVILAAARAQLLAYPQAEGINGVAEHAVSDDGGFAVTLATGEVFRSARLVLATGLTDRLPDLPGLAGYWGRTVLHCPYCHAYEIAGERIGVLATGAASSELANLASDWGKVMLFTQGLELEREPLARFFAAGGRLEERHVVSLEDDAQKGLVAKLADGSATRLDALFVAPDFALAGSLATQLGCRLIEGPHGWVVETASDGRTSVANVYAAGDMASLHHNASLACAAGVSAGIAAHQSLVE